MLFCFISVLHVEGIKNHIFMNGTEKINETQFIKII